MHYLTLATLAVLSLFTGCASVSVTDVRQSSQGTSRPTRFYVADFETGGGEWKITSRSRTPEQFKRETADALATALTANLNTFVGPAQRIGSSRSVPRDGWLVTGRFLRVNEGNPAARIAVGLGAGGSKMETNTVVLDGGSGRSVLQFETTGGSNAMPGVLLSTGPGSAVTSAVTQANLGVRDDAKRTARMITGAISDHLVERGWLAKARLRAKRSGEFQILQPQGPRIRRR